MLDPRETQDSPPIKPPYNKRPLAEAVDKQPSHAAFDRLVEFAVYLNENQYIYGFFGAPDGFVLAYSMLRYPFDLLHSASKSEAAKALRHHLNSPEGFTLALAWLASLSVWSTYANGMSKQKDPDAKARYVYWQATRDAMKGLRNIHRGLRSLFDVMQLLQFVDIRDSLPFVGLALGVPSAYNRWWIRHMVTARKKTMDTNNTLSEELLSWGRFDDTLAQLPHNDELEENHANTYLLINKADEQNRNLYYINHEGKPEKLFTEQEDVSDFIKNKAKLKLKLCEHPTDPEKNQTQPTVLQWNTLLPTQTNDHVKAFTDHIKKKLDDNTTLNQAHDNRDACTRSAGYAGFVNGLYLFIPFVSFATFSPIALALAALLSTACMFALILTHIQEEEEFDKLLHVSKDKAEFNLHIKQFEDEIVQLAQINEAVAQSPDEDAHTIDRVALNKMQRDANDTAEATLSKIITCFNKIQATSTIADHEAILIGLRHGLTVHGAIVCLIFAASLVSTHLCATLLPPVIILAGVVTSVLITAMFIDTVRQHAQEFSGHQEETKTRHLAALKHFLNTVKDANSTEVLGNLDDHIILTQLSTPSRSIWPWLNRIELLRAFSSGLMKGIKSTEFIVTFLLATSDLSEQHEHDHNRYFIWQCLALITCAIIWTFRGLAKFADKFADPDETPSPPAFTSATPDETPSSTRPSPLSPDFTRLSQNANSLFSTHQPSVAQQTPEAATPQPTAPMHKSQSCSTL